MARIKPYKQIVDPNTNELCEDNEIGEICSKTDYQTMGYLDPREDEDVFDSQGFVRTGDLGYYDIWGELYYVDRMKAMIK